jgi:hypothetical protein
MFEIHVHLCEFNLRGFSASHFFPSPFFFFFLADSILGQHINVQPNTSIYICSLDGPRTLRSARGAWQPAVVNVTSDTFIFP